MLHEKFRPGICVLSLSQTFQRPNEITYSVNLLSAKKYHKSYRINV